MACMAMATYQLGPVTRNAQDCSILELNIEVCANWPLSIKTRKQLKVRKDWTGKDQMSNDRQTWYLKNVTRIQTGKQ